MTIEQGSSTAHVESETLLAIYRTMLASRVLDERCTAMLAAGQPVPHYHSGVGQEALMVAPVAALQRGDSMIYTHRGYGHLLAKGVPLEQVVLDMFMKEGGTNRGHGGVMHVCRPDLGVHGREGMFGARFGVSVGLAMAARNRGSDDVVLCFYGEAAGARGQLYEAMNMAVLWKLPIVFVAENNGWSFSSRTEWLYPEGLMSRVWRGFEIPVNVIDGNDAKVVLEATRTALVHARSGAGPCVLEGLTYRLAPHIWWDDQSYQPAEEIDRWQREDPLSRTHGALLEMGIAQSTLVDARARAEAEVKRALDLATDAPAATWPERKPQ